MIPISKPYLTDYILQYAHDALNTGWISSSGYYVNAATELFKEKTGAEFVLLVNNGTSATHLVSKCLQKFKGGNSIIAPSNVYVAAYNSFLFDNYWFIKSVDADMRTWNIDIGKVADVYSKGDNILVVHNLGNRIDLNDFPQDTNYVEDNCEGFSTDYVLSERSLCSSVSFFGNKIISCGEGGAFVCHSPDVLEYARRVQGQGQTSEKFIHDIMGTNYRMTNIQAAILYGELKYSDEIIERRNAVFSNYEELVKDLPVKTQKYVSHSKWMFAVRIQDNPSYKKADEFFRSRDIETRPMFYPMSSHKHLKVYARDEMEVVAKVLSREVVLLPTYAELTLEKQKQVVFALEEYLCTIQ